MTTSTTVLIVGAGPTGLALAHGLKKAGISSIVLEKYPSLTVPRDWNMGLHWGAESLRAVISDSLWARIQSCQVDPSQPTAEIDHLNMLNGQTGELLTAIPANYFYRIRRSNLRHLLAPGVDIRYNTQLQSTEYSPDGHHVTALLDNGQKITAHLIVGADGARSKTRQALLGPEAGLDRQLPYCATFMQARYTADQARFLRDFHPLFLAAISPAGYFSFFGMHDVEDPSRPETWTFFSYISWFAPPEERDRMANWSNAQRLQQVKELSKAFTDPWRSAFEWLPDDQQVWSVNLTYFDPREPGHRWDNHEGRITLAGDAAHAMTYQRGQGMNHSMTDAARLAEAIGGFVSGEMSQSEAISGYETEMIERAGAEAALSAVNTEMVHDWQKVMASPVFTSGLKRTNGG
ncbi:hypothetical protein FE257_012771 [Aspergillus nanangensis]|uniref:FAD-binding domain-containing protein n=1 Tax=Aspergillus nanangensis TaxID=2582783 RepID=A0AAD4GQJ9_ASPNN|nr:hypothetical protein FE257_012771 [Aspergillus nanangensis]